MDSLKTITIKQVVDILTPEQKVDLFKSTIEKNTSLLDDVIDGKYKLIKCCKSCGDCEFICDCECCESRNVHIVGCDKCGVSVCVKYDKEDMCGVRCTYDYIICKQCSDNLLCGVCGSTDSIDRWGESAYGGSCHSCKVFMCCECSSYTGSCFAKGTFSCPSCRNVPTNL